MGKQMIEYFASKSALTLWFGLSAVFCLILFFQISATNEGLSVVKIIFFLTDMVHFWLPIIAGKYLYRLSKEQS